MTIEKIVRSLYPNSFTTVVASINKLIESNNLSKTKRWIDQTDIMLISYGDSIYKKYEQPLVTFNRFLKNNFDKLFTNVHFLPFYPYTSDDGFSVVDYYSINPDLGEWKNVKEIAKDYNLMFDAVINHISQKSEWFVKYLNGDKEYRDFFVECDPKLDYSTVVRPRALPLYYEYQSRDGVKNIWATFSDDQIDLNYKNPKVLLKVLEVLIFYVKNGASFLRLDAVGFIWKEIGTSSIHLPQAHLIINLMRLVLDEINAGVILITETNVPHKENISYFGNELKEAQLVYQFPLPPLVVHTFLAKDSSKINNWLESLSKEIFPSNTSFFNFLSSHDGIGVRPVEGILNSAELENMLKHVETMGGKISYRNNKDGSKSPYELNITYYDALAHTDDNSEVRQNRFIAAHALLLSLKGMPGIYINSFLANRNDYQGLTESGINRRINRHKFDYDLISLSLKQPQNESTKVTFRLKHLIELRKNIVAFSPDAAQEIIKINNKVIAINRTSFNSRILVLINITDEPVSINYQVDGEDIIAKEVIKDIIKLNPYQVRWIEVK